MKRILSYMNRLLNSKEVGMVVLLAILLVGLYFFAWREMRFFVVPSASMEPTLYPSDMIVTLGARHYQRGDIVVWLEDDEYVVKRIIGLPNDSITVVDGALFINGKYAPEPYMAEPMRYFMERPALIPEGRFFYLGDNRNASEDSSLGFVPPSTGAPSPASREWLGNMDAIVGKVRFIYYPYARFGPINAYPLINVAGQ